jgi:hypothetical protein
MLSYEKTSLRWFKEREEMKLHNLARTCALNLVALATLALPPAAIAADAEAIIECHNFATAVHLCDALGGCDRDYKIQRRYFDAAVTCISHWLDCDLYERIGSPKALDCPSRAIERCQGVYADMSYFLSDKALFQRSQFVEHCTPLDFATEFLAGPPLGLDFDDAQGTCIFLGTPLQSLDDFAICGDKHQMQLYGAMLTLVAPRAREFLVDNQFCNLFPEHGETPVECNSALGPHPPVGGVPDARVGLVRKCQKALHKGLKQILHRHLTHLESCAEDHLRCEVRKTYGAISGSGYDQCIEKADTWCTRLRDTRDVWIPRSVDRIKRSCDDVTFDDMTDILGFGSIAAGCGADTVSEVIECLPDKVKCIAWDSERFVEGRMIEDTPGEYLTDYLTCGN